MEDSHILIISPDHEYGISLAEAFEARHHRVDRVTSTKAGLASATAARPDIIVLAIDSPDPSCFGLFGRLRRDQSLGAVPVVVVSSDASQDVLSRYALVRDAALHHLHKTLSPDAVVQRCESLQSKACARQAEPTGLSATPTHSESDSLQEFLNDAIAALQIPDDTRTEHVSPTAAAPDSLARTTPTDGGTSTPTEASPLSAPPNRQASPQKMAPPSPQLSAKLSPAPSSKRPSPQGASADAPPAASRITAAVAGILKARESNARPSVASEPAKTKSTPVLDRDTSSAGTSTDADSSQPLRFDPPGPDRTTPVNARKVSTVIGMDLSAPTKIAYEMCLVVLAAADPKNVGGRTPIASDGIDIGRGSECGIVLDDPRVSSRHCIVVIRDDVPLLIDQRSSNGTFLNDERVEEHVLCNGDRIRVGSAVLKYISGSDMEAQYHKTVTDLAVTDSLTGVFNRRHVDAQIKREVERAEAASKPLSLIAVHVDHLNHIGDTYGEDVADCVLVDIARRLKSTAAGGIVGRTAGGSFVILFPNVALAEAVPLARHFRDAIAGDAVRTAEQSVAATVSLGVADLGQSVTQEALSWQASERVYAAIRRGGNCVVPENAEPVGTASVNPRRVLDGPWMLHKLLAKDVPASLMGFELGDEATVLRFGGTTLRERWLQELLSVVEHELKGDDLLARWRDRYVLAAFVDRNRSQVGVAQARIIEVWNALPVPEEYRHELTRKLRVARLWPDDIQAHQQQALDQIALRLLERPRSDRTVSTLPFPLAFTEAILAEKTNAQARAHCLIWGIDVGLRFLLAIEMATLLSEPSKSIRQAVAKLVQPELDRPVSIGTLASLLVKLCGMHSEQRKGPLARLLGRQQEQMTTCGSVGQRIAHRLVEVDGQQSDLAKRLGPAIQERNTIKHGPGMPEGTYAEQEKILRAGFEAILEAAEPLSRCEMVNVDDILGWGSGNEVRYRLRVHRGPAERFSVREIGVPARLEKSPWCYLLDDSGHPPLSLAPWFADQDCTVCGRAEVFVASQLSMAPADDLIEVMGLTSAHKARISAGPAGGLVPIQSALHG